MGIHNHAVINTGQLLNSKWNWNLRINKCGKTICDLSIFHQYSTNFNDLTGKGGKSCGLNVENHESSVQGLFFRVGDHTL